MKTERELYVLELSGFGVIDAVFSEINECVDFSCFDFCGLTKDDITFGYRVWLASKNREGYKLVPVEPTQVMLDKFPEVLYQDTYAGECSMWIDDETIRLGYKAMLEAAEK